MLLDELQILKQDKYYGAIGMLFIAVTLSLATWTFYKNPKLEPSYEMKMAEDLKICTEFAKHKGFEVNTVTPSIIEITNNNLQESTFIYATSESVLLACSNFDMKRFCLGDETECGISGLKIVLGYEKPNEI